MILVYAPRVGGDELGCLLNSLMFLRNYHKSKDWFFGKNYVDEESHYEPFEI